MPCFICLNLIIAYAVHTHNSLEALLRAPLTEYVGLVGCVLGLGLLLWQKIGLAWRYDIFCSAASLIWISTWPPFFNEDSPVIFFYPLFFCFVSIAIHFGFVQQAAAIDSLSLSYMRAFAAKRVTHTLVLTGGVLVSLRLIEHYRMFPSIMVLLLFHYALLSILEARAQDVS